MRNILIKRKGEKLAPCIPHQISLKGAQRLAGKPELAKRQVSNGFYTATLQWFIPV
jgi:hypothetical protein